MKTKHIKVTALTLTAALILSSVPAPTFAESKLDQFFNQVTTALNGTTFKDTAKHWGKSYIERLASEGYVKGSNGNFNPDQTLKTEDFLIMALKVIKPEFKEFTAAKGEAYYKPYFEKAKEIGLIKDVNYDEVPQYEGRDMPRELAVQVVDRALSLMGEKGTADHGLEYKFEDYNIINDINKEAVLKAYQLGIIKGSNGNFEPKNPLTRAEAAVLITKLLDKNMRDKMTFSKNTKTYNEVTNWYLNGLQAQVDKRTIVVEKKNSGIINTGDVDYTEKPFKLGGKLVNWWTDQQYEDETTGRATEYNTKYCTKTRFPTQLEGNDLTDVSGSYLPYDGELLFTNIQEVRNGKCKKYYEMPVNNFNRLSYDLLKYGTQYAKASGNYLTHLVVEDSHFFYGLSATEQNTQCNYGYVAIYTKPAQSAESSNAPFAPQVGFCVEDYETAVDHEALLNQWLIRLYGAQEGPTIFKFYKDYAKGKNRGSKSKPLYKTYKGIQLYFSDAEGVSPYMEATLK